MYDYYAYYYPNMSTEMIPSKVAVPSKFMRPRQYAPRVGINWRTCYRYITEGVLPAYKFQGILVVDVDETDAIIKGLVRRVPVPMKSPGKAGRPKKHNPIGDYPRGKHVASNANREKAETAGRAKGRTSN